MTYTLAIDPGTTKSAWVVIDDLLKPVVWAWEENEKVADKIDNFEGFYALIEKLRPDETWDGEYDVDLVIEDVTHMGMAVGRHVFETVRWSGRFDYRQTARFISRQDVKLHICGSPRARDPNIKQAIIDRYGGQEQAIGGVQCSSCSGSGTRRKPGTRGRRLEPGERIPCPDCEDTAGYWTLPGWEVRPGILYEFSKAGMGSHGWSALAVALTAVGTEPE